MSVHTTDYNCGSQYVQNSYANLPSYTADNQLWCSLLLGRVGVSKVGYSRDESFLNQLY